MKIYQMQNLEVVEGLCRHKGIWNNKEIAAVATTTIAGTLWVNGHLEVLTLPWARSYNSSGHVNGGFSFSWFSRFCRATTLASMLF